MIELIIFTILLNVLIFFLIVYKYTILNGKLDKLTYVYAQLAAMMVIDLNGKLDLGELDGAK